MYTLGECSELCSTLDMKSFAVCVSVSLFIYINGAMAQCGGTARLTFVRWSGMSPEGAAPVFVYSASGDEESLAGACLARCRELPDCAAVAVAYNKGNCHGVAAMRDVELRQDYDVSYFKKICLELSEGCTESWWALESTPGYNLHAEEARVRVMANVTVRECYSAVLAGETGQHYRSAQWVGPQASINAELVKMSEEDVGNCILSSEDKFTEPESYRVSNYYTFYIENQCRHDYPRKIDRCSYEEYYNQTLKHVELTTKNRTKDECKALCEVEQRFVCRGFTWTERPGASARGLCDLHSEDLVTTGSWLLRRTSPATFYRRVICLNITVDCEGPNLVVTYRPRGVFRGRVYVPGRGERCGARASGRAVRLTLPLYGDCDVNFAYAITKTPTGTMNRTMAYVIVMIQNNPIIQTAGDRWVRVGCSPGARTSTHAVDATVNVRDTSKPSQVSELSNGAAPASASAVYNANTAPLTMYVVRAVDDSPNAAAAVSLGEPLELRIETTDNNEIEAYHLVASSRLGDSSVLLLDSRGCPTGQVDFPSFSRTKLGGTQRLSARFKAFRFPTSHVVRFALMVRFCEGQCAPVNCVNHQGRSARDTNDTSYQLDSNGIEATVKEESWHDSRLGNVPNGVVAQGGAALCGASDGQVPLEVEMVVGSGDVLSADTLIHADHQANIPEDITGNDEAMVCVHELLLVALALAWLAVQVLLLVGCCVLVKRYRKLAELSLQKDYQSFDNVGFDNVSTHRRVHWPDQNIDILHAN
ncbi:unnamed protein product [Chilo suppressalis]|uniref:ZP domain-containing protein n=1 Tax=Chilo suppressalis TaxID=168631 RepID=A0ABN8BB04_CHISP|nr:unnamed protein product [Chilo suppressalis]